MNHGGIYLGGGIFLHHLEKRLSVAEGLIQYRGKSWVWLRHAG